MAGSERVVDGLNRALHSLFAREEGLCLLGQDIADPYGGAFGVTRGLSTRYPERVISTPISEAAMTGVASGMALCGDKVIVEVMFGDFATLTFDQLLNFATKSVSMYGSRRPMRLVLRCPVGGNRGYGPTHSQSLQKHFIGIPHLSLYELSAFHNAESLLERILGTGEPAILFEPKALYGERVHHEGELDRTLACELLDGGWAHISTPMASGKPVVLLAPGGMAERAIAAGRSLAAEDQVQAHILVPDRLYPLDLWPVADILTSAAVICVAEEGMEGGTWGTEVAARIYAQYWDRLASPVLLVNSRSSVIPAAPHLERKVLAGADTIIGALRPVLGQPAATRAARRASCPGPLPSTDPPERPNSISVRVPKLNNNDATYVLLSWLAKDGQRVQAGSPIAEVETSKAVEELEAATSGMLRVAVPPGTECVPGQTIAWLTAVDQELASEPPEPIPCDSRAVTPPPAPASESQPLVLNRAQKRVADVVSRSHRDIPAAFVAVNACIDAVLRAMPALDEAADGAFGLLEVLVMAVAKLRPRFPACFGTGVDAGAAHARKGAHIAVTLDAHNGLFMPVIRSAEHRPAAEIADELAALRMQALRGAFAEEDLAGANIAISWNSEPNVMLVQPIIPPGLTCMISVTGARRDVGLAGPRGELAERSVVGLGLAHDHRLVNGREATEFLLALSGFLDDEQQLTQLVCGCE
jgi:pyruvate/2-oxoglutarate/acetoin dehydrogenase E1 component/pyruvate/2-oxoglutarate dehydrogenase complex dihydrolipoamide acyltransferase (E2) component